MKYRDHFLIILSALFYGLITVGGKYFADLGFSLYEISLLIFFYLPPLIPILIFSKKYRLRKEHFGFYLIFGVFGAGLQISQFAGIVLGVPVAVVALLLYTQPIWTILFGKILLQEKITSKKIFAIGLAVIGIAILLNPFGVENRYNPVGLAAALCGGFFFSLWVIWGRKSGLKGQHAVTTSFGYALFTSIVLVAIYPVLGFFIKAPELMRLDFSNYIEFGWAVLAFGIFAGLIPAILAFSGMRKIEASIAGILLLFEPISAAILAYFWFDQHLTSGIFLGGGIILLANYVLLRR